MSSVTSGPSPSTSNRRLAGSCSANASSAAGMSLGIPAPIRTTSTPASIAPYSEESVGSWILVSRLMPTGPACPSLARYTSTKLASIVNRSRAADERRR